MQNHIELANIRLENNLTQKEMAKLLNVCLSNYKLYEVGLRAISLEQANIISNNFHISLDFIFNLSKKKYIKNSNPEIDYDFLKINLKDIRRKNHITIKTMGIIFNLSATTISKYEKNPKTISTYYLCGIAKKFNISINYLCGKIK